MSEPSHAGAVSLNEPAPVAPPGSRRERGAATAEFAVAMPGVVLLLLVGLTAVAALIAKVECVDAAREAARAAARGADGAAAGARAAPAHAQVSVSTGRSVRATVTAPVIPLGSVLSSLTVSGSAVAEAEPGVVP
ncbi:TadE family type IV pilus minor pilin [Actinocatenispora sera]|uniref:TadE family type IV pilus minor pilin n=1 Tax=Actinocatenispora sera TaxID=390989 RepID=UPI003F4D5DBD